MEHDADTLSPVIDEVLHPEGKPFCYEPECPCHEDEGEIAILHSHVEQGHLTPEEATNIVNGKTI